MSQNHASPSCPDCSQTPAQPTRREVLRQAVGTAAIVSAASAGLVSMTITERSVFAAEEAAKVAAAKSSETLVGQLYGSLTEAQRAQICFPFNHPLQSRVENNWQIVKKGISEVLDKEQQALVKEIFMGMHSPEYAQKVWDQIESDGSGKGFFMDDCAIALFGEPDKTGNAEKSKFQFVLTGRHCTRRCDGNSVEGASFGGPIFYGHAARGFNEKPDHPGNAYWYQALQANEVYKALDEKQKKVALLTGARKEQGVKTVALTGKKEGLPGIAARDLSADQRELVNKVLADLLAPFRKADADEAMKHVTAGGLENLHMAFYKDMDIGNDGVWDVWQVEGPNMIWYFRGAPHVHTWVNIRDPNVAESKASKA